MKFATFLVFSMTCLLAWQCSSNPTVSEDIVARVNGKEITSAELDKQFQLNLNAVQQGTQQLPTPEETQLLKFQLLSQMIENEILLQMAASSGLTATDAEVETKYTELKSRYTEEQFQEMLKQQKVQPEDIKKDMRRSLTLEKLVSKEITSRIEVNEAEIQEAYDKNKEQRP